MGLISPGGENLLHFLELPQVLSTYDGGLREGQSSCELLGVSQDSSTVDAGAYDLVWIRCRNLRIPLECYMDLGVLLESPQGSQSSSRVGECT